MSKYHSAYVPPDICVCDYIEQWLLARAMVATPPEVTATYISVELKRACSLNSNDWDKWRRWMNGKHARGGITMIFHHHDCYRTLGSLKCLDAVGL